MSSKKSKSRKSALNPQLENPKGNESLKLSRRSFMKASAAGAAVVGVGLSLRPKNVSLSTGQSATSTSSDPFATIPITLNVNGRNYSMSVEPRAMLVNVLRENLGLTGTKRPCNRMECGGCTVLIDNSPVYSCTTMAVRAQGLQIMTVEANNPGQLATPDHVLDTIQKAWVANDASQCGYCQPGRVMATTALLKSNSNPTPQEIQAGLEGILCRCGTYINVIAAVQAAAKSL
ncbi:MAG: (2Fe-2S)-binding protein [Rhabdochlamydiaceae bacterium]